MTQSTVALLPHDLAVIARLETIGKPVGFAEAPAGALQGVQRRTGPDYMILWPLNADRDGSLGDPYTQADLIYQVTCAGRLAKGVRDLVDMIEPALLGITITGRSVIQIVPEDGGQVRPDDDVVPPVFIATPRYRIRTVPA